MATKSQGSRCCAPRDINIPNLPRLKGSMIIAYNDWKDWYELKSMCTQAPRSDTVTCKDHSARWEIFTGLDIVERNTPHSVKFLRRLTRVTSRAGFRAFSSMYKTEIHKVLKMAFHPHVMLSMPAGFYVNLFIAAHSKDDSKLAYRSLLQHLSFTFRWLNTLDEQRKTFGWNLFTMRVREAFTHTIDMDASLKMLRPPSNWLEKKSQYVDEVTWNGFATSVNEAVKIRFEFIPKHPRWVEDLARLGEQLLEAEKRSKANQVMKRGVDVQHSGALTPPRSKAGYTKPREPSSPSSVGNRSDEEEWDANIRQA